MLRVERESVVVGAATTVVVVVVVASIAVAVIDRPISHPTAIAVIITITSDSSSGSGSHAIIVVLDVTQHRLQVAVHQAMAQILDGCGAGTTTIATTSATIAAAVLLATSTVGCEEPVHVV